MLEKQAKVRHPQDNYRNMVNKLEKGSKFTKRASQQSNKAQPLKRQKKGVEDEKIKYARSVSLNARMSHIKNGIGYKMGDKLMSNKRRSKAPRLLTMFLILMLMLLMFLIYHIIILMLLMYL
jgi:hypothetical protein